MIVKIQTSVVSSDGEQHTLIYNEDRSFQCEWPTVPDGIKDVMKGRPKAFFYATSIDEQLEVGEEAEWQVW